MNKRICELTTVIIYKVILSDSHCLISLSYQLRPYRMSCAHYLTVRWGLIFAPIICLLHCTREHMVFLATSEAHVEVNGKENVTSFLLVENMF